MTTIGYTLGFDATNVFLIPAGAEVVFCYPDGRFANEAAARARFPHAYIVPLTTRAGRAEGIDWEPGDSEPNIVTWLEQDGEGERPVIYADLSDLTGTLLPKLKAHYGTIPPPGPGRPFRLLSAHPTGIEHICGPHSCGQLDVDADGTQYLWSPRGVNIDVSALLPSFILSGIPTVPVGVDPMSVTIAATPDGNLVALAQAEADAGKVGEVFALWTTAPGGNDAGGPVWHGEPDVTPHLWVSLGTPGT